MCPQIKEVLKPIMDEGDINLSKLCKLANLQIGNLVLADEFGGEDKGKNIMCVMYALGKCT